MTNEETQGKEITQAIVMLPIPKEQIIRNFKEIQELKGSLIEESDKMQIGGHPYILKSGWRKLAFAFNVTDTIIKADREQELGKDYFVWRIQVRAIAPNGRTSTGIGACASNERKFAHEEHDVYAMAHTRAKNRAFSDILGLGEVSAEEMSSDVSEELKSIPQQKPVPRDPSAPASDKQKAYIDSLVKKYKVDITDLLAKMVHGHTLDSLTMEEAQKVLDHLKMIKEV